MKSHIQPQYSQRELKIMGAYVDKRVQDCLSKVQWLMLLAFHDVLGVGERRFMQVMERYGQLLEEYKGYQRDEIADQKLTQAAKAILPNSFSRLYE